MGLIARIDLDFCYSEAIARPSKVIANHLSFFQIVGAFASSEYNHEVIGEGDFPSTLSADDPHIVLWKKLDDDAMIKEIGSF